MQLHTERGSETLQEKKISTVLCEKFGMLVCVPVGEDNHPEVWMHADDIVSLLATLTRHNFPPVYQRRHTAHHPRRLRVMIDKEPS
jgi:hypothetical protein